MSQLDDIQKAIEGNGIILRDFFEILDEERIEELGPKFRGVDSKSLLIWCVQQKYIELEKGKPPKVSSLGMEALDKYL